MQDDDSTRTGRRFSWIKVDDHLSEHPKILEVGPLAAWLYVCSIQYGNRRRTDGFVPARAIYTLVDLGGCGEVCGCVGKDQEPDYAEVHASQLAERLVAAGLWERVEGGYVVHHYLDWQVSAAKIDTFHARDRTRKLQAVPPPNPNGFHAESARNPDGKSAESIVVDQDVEEDIDVDQDVDQDEDAPGVQGGAAPAGAVCVPKAKDAPEPVQWVWDYYREYVQPEARVCPRAKIAARLQRFTVDELTLGIEHFAADGWCMERNGHRGGGWFFHSDARTEQFLAMTPRRNPGSAR